MINWPEAEGEGAGPGTVLVIEDDRPTRELLAAILADEDLPYQLASTGHEAMEHARRSTPAMVVLDFHLPFVRGEAVATALRIEYGHALPILAMSASDEKAAAQRVGAFDYVQKPFEIDDFVKKVRHGLELAERSQSLRSSSDRARDRLQQTMERQRQAFEALRRIEPPESGIASGQ